ncbi:hypothetical protein FB451DRAFT_1562073 [Mycena latifolia]|nr:hypothetical protein FB451DRAFT_1562073 [Mycena latifolia]
MFRMPWGPWATGLALLPQLAHLSFHHAHPPHSACQHILQGCDALQVFVLLSGSQSYVDLNVSSYESFATDPRFVVLLVQSTRDDWAIGARKGEDFWLRAEALVQERRATRTNDHVPSDS